MAAKTSPNPASQAVTKTLLVASTQPYGLQGLLPLLQGVAEERCVPCDHLVLQEQERLNTVVLILDGVVKVRSRQTDGAEEVLGILGGGECIGIASVFGADHAWGDVVALTSVRLMRLPKTAVIELILRTPEAAFHFMAMMAGSLGTVRERVLARHLQPSERVLVTLGELARKANPAAPASAPLLAPPISQTELATLTGVARETCSRCMSKLQRRGLIRRTPEGWTLVPASPAMPLTSVAEAPGRGAGAPNRSPTATVLPCPGPSTNMAPNQRWKPADGSPS